MTEPRTDIMSPENEPTDEELALVMREARVEAVRKRDLAEKALRLSIQAAVKVRLDARRERLAKRPVALRF